MSINIEEERVAFDYATPLDEYVTITNREYYDLYREHLFGIWLKAKEHAVEMAKPSLILTETMGDRWGLYRPDCTRARHTELTKAKCIQWANANGYRVIEE